MEKAKLLAKEIQERFKAEDGEDVWMLHMEGLKPAINNLLLMYLPSKTTTVELEVLACVINDIVWHPETYLSESPTAPVKEQVESREVYETIEIKEGCEMPKEQEYCFVLAQWKDEVVKQLARYDSLERNWTCETKNTKVTHWLKKVTLPIQGNLLTEELRERFFRDCCENNGTEFKMNFKPKDAIRWFKSQPEFGKKENDVPGVQPKDEADVASHSCTIGNSIQQGWISTRERLPELKKKYDEDNDSWYDESDFVLVANDDDYYGQLACYDGDNLWWLFGEAEPFDMVKYWMPVPPLLNSDKNVPVSDTTEAK